LNSPFIDRRSYETLRKKTKVSLAALVDRGRVLSASPWLQVEILDSNPTESQIDGLAAARSEF
jgi:hypothetical protein